MGNKCLKFKIGVARERGKSQSSSEWATSKRGSGYVGEEKDENGRENNEASVCIKGVIHI
jgi:hypothetical protein